MLVVPAVLWAQDAARTAQAESVSPWETLTAWGGGWNASYSERLQTQGLEAPPPGLGHMQTVHTQVLFFNHS